MNKIILAIILFLCVSCKTTKTVYVPVTEVKKEYVNSKDSVYIHDSIYYEVSTKNDTIFETKYKYKIVERYAKDTVVIVDSIPTIQEVEKIVEVNTLYWWQKLLMIAGGIVLLFILLYFGIKLSKIV